MSLKMNDVATLLASEVNDAMKKGKIQTVKEMRSFIPKMIEGALGTGTPGYRQLSEAIAKDVAQRIPTGALFSPDKGHTYDPAAGFRGMSETQLKDLHKRVVFAIAPAGVRSSLFSPSDVLEIGKRMFVPDGQGGKRALSVEVGSAGGFTLPDEFVAEVARKLVHTSVFLNVCRVFSGVEMQGKMPRETGTVSVTYQNELTQPTATQFKLGQITWSLNKRFALTQLSRELFKFGGIDTLDLLATMFAEQYQKTVDYFALLGSGSGQPMGLLSMTTGMTSLAIGGSSTVWQDIFRLKHALKSQYRLEKASCAFMTNNATIELCSTLTDDQNRPVFIDRGTEGMGSNNIPPQTVGFMAGHAVLENPYMPGPQAETLNNDTIQDVASTAKIVFSNFKRGYFWFAGQSMETMTSDQAYDAFLTDSLYTRAIDYNDGKPAIPEATAILTGVK